MAHSELVIGPDGWNGWAVHVSQDNLPVGTPFQPLSVRFGANTPEMQSFHAVFPLDGPGKILNYWVNQVQDVPAADRGSYNAWLTEAAIETVRQAEFPDLPSRLDSIFAFRCGAEAVRFAIYYRTGQIAFLYEFQPLNGTVMIDMKIWDSCTWDYAQPAAAFDIFMNMARAYWHSATVDLTGEDLARPELLVPTPVAVVAPAISFERGK